MHFHLPKPLHGWREFAGEVGIIVVGVLIALGAEQVIEDAHWRHATEQAANGMRHDAVGERDALLARYNQRSCVDRRLADIGVLFARHDAGQPIVAINKLGRPLYSSGSSPSWDVAVADGSVAHLSFGQRNHFAQAFEIYRAYEKTLADEKRAWQQLQMLNHVASFTASDWSEARQAFDLASDFEASFLLTLPVNIRAFAFLGRPGPNPDERANPFTTALCRPLFARQ